jgi:hypothetical protein
MPDPVPTPKENDPIFWWKVGILMVIIIVAAIGYALTGN